MRPLTAAAGFKNDVEELLKRLEARGSVDFAQFAEVWRQMQMPYVFWARRNDFEVRELLDDCFEHLLDELNDKLGRQSCQSVASCLINLLHYHTDLYGPRNVVLFYVLYALYDKQPTEPKINIRLTTDKFDLLLAIVRHAHFRGWQDVVDIWHELVAVHAFHFVQRNKLFGPVFMRSNFNACDTIPSTVVTAKESLVEQDKLLIEFEDIAKEYKDVMLGNPNIAKKLREGLGDVADVDISKDNDSLRSFYQSVVDANNKEVSQVADYRVVVKKEEEQPEPEDIGARRRKLRHRRLTSSSD